MECLNNRIGIKGCGAPAVAAVPAVIGDPDAIPPIVAVPGIPALPLLFINDLPGVTTAMIDALVNGEQDTYLDVWTKIVKRAMTKFLLLVKAEINKCWKITDNSIVTCLVCGNKDLFDVALWYLHGSETMIEITSSDQASRYTTIDLDKCETLKAEFYSEFSDFLADAVASICIKNNPCIPAEVCVEKNSTYNWGYSFP